MSRSRSTFVPYYLKTLHVLSERYGIGSGVRGRTFSGRAVWKDAVHAVAPVPHLLNWFTVFALVGLVVLLVTRRRAAVVPVLAIGLPVAFFTVVPTKGLSALFFDRYMLPALPSFLLLVAIGCATVAGWAGRARWLVLGILVAGLMTLETRVVLARQRQLSHLELGRITAVVRGESRGAVLFGTTGSEDATGYLGAFNFGRPPNLLDRYLELRISSLELVDDDTCIPVVAFLAHPGPRRSGSGSSTQRDPTRRRSPGRRSGRSPACSWRTRRRASSWCARRSRSRRDGSSSSGSRCAAGGSGSCPGNRACRDLVEADAQALRARRSGRARARLLDEPEHLAGLAGEPPP